MRLTRDQYYKIKDKLTRLCGIHRPIFYENGTFEIYNIPETDIYNLKSKLKQSDFVDSIDAYKGRDDFNHFNFNRGFAEPTKYWNIRGFVKVPENESLEDMKRLAKEEEDAIASYDRSIKNADSEEEEELYKHIQSEEEEHFEELTKLANGEEVDIDEAVEIHKTLNPKIWDDEQKLIPEVKSKILEIVEKFKEYISKDGVELKVEDIYLLGSNANYNYNNDSDLDIHIIADESLDCEGKHLPLLYDAYKSLFNSKYEITIKGINVELYVENAADMTNVSAGIYSLNKGWIRKPDQYKMPDIDQEAVSKGVDGWEKRYFELTENGTPDKIDAYINEIYQLRKESIQKEGEFGLGNLIFKEVRRLGYLQDLKKLKDELTSQELSLEGLN